MASLFEYNRQLDELFARATDEDGTIDESLMEELEALQMDRAEKLDNCIWFYKSRKAMAAALKDEKRAIERRQKTAEREAESMKDYLAFCLHGEKHESKAGKISYRRNQTVEVTDMDKLPDEFKRWKAEPNKTALKDELIEGVVIEGVHLVDKVSTIIK